MRTGDLGFYLDGALYVIGRLADLITIDGRQLYPEDLEATTEDASHVVRRGHVTAFGTEQGVVIIAERASGTRGVDPALAVDAIRAEVSSRHRLTVFDVRLVAAGAIPRTTSGKLARRACRTAYLDGGFGE